MGAGTAVVASDVGMNSEIIVSSQNGFLAGSAEEWETALRQLIGNGELRRSFGLRGRELVETRYSLSDYCRRYATFLERVARPADSLPDLDG